MWLKKNFSSFFDDLRTKPFELQVWFVVMTIAGLRTLKAVVQDITGVKVNAAGFIIDLSILLIFCALAWLIYSKKIPRVPLIVGVLLLIPLIFSYVQFGGVMGTTEYNLMGLGVLFALAYNRKQLAIIMSLYFVLILVANLDLRMNGWLTRSFFKGNSTSLDNYLTTLVTLLLIILYFKKALASEGNRVTELRKKLGEQIKTIVRQKRELEEKKQFLHKVNARLQQDIRSHSDVIVRQNSAIKDYIWLSTESLEMPLKSINTEVANLNEDNILGTLLKEQVVELNGVVENLKRELLAQSRTNK